jgi:glycosyltransferase involved in cell wall biosynthesis
VSSRPRVSFIAWSPRGGRADDVARVLGGEARWFDALGIVRRWAIPVRYAIDSLRTAAYLARRRPRAVIVVNPPIFPAAIALAYARVARVPLVLDSHPSAFGLAGDELSRRLAWLHARVARRATTTLVSDETLARRVRGWGAPAEVFHEPPSAFSLRPAPGLDGRRPQVLFAGVFSRDEPVRELVEAARLTPEVDVRITGEPKLCPPGLRESAPPNVHFVGFLHGADYVRALDEADAVIALSTEPTSVMRTAYEAVWGLRPLLVSDSPNLRGVFPDAIHVRNDAAAIAGGLRDLIGRHAELVALAPAARERQQRRWETQLAALRSHLDPDRPSIRA